MSAARSSPRWRTSPTTPTDSPPGPSVPPSTTRLADRIAAAPHLPCRVWLTRSVRRSSTSARSAPAAHQRRRMSAGSRARRRSDARSGPFPGSPHPASRRESDVSRSPPAGLAGHGGRLPPAARAGGPRLVVADHGRVALVGRPASDTRMSHAPGRSQAATSSRPEGCAPSGRRRQAGSARGDLSDDEPADEQAPAGAAAELARPVAQGRGQPCWPAEALVSRRTDPGSQREADDEHQHRRRRDLGRRGMTRGPNAASAAAESRPAATAAGHSSASTQFSQGAGAQCDRRPAPRPCGPPPRARGDRRARAEQGRVDACAEPQHTDRRAGGTRVSADRVAPTSCSPSAPSRPPSSGRYPGARPRGAGQRLELRPRALRRDADASRPTACVAGRCGRPTGRPPGSRSGAHSWAAWPGSPR